LRTKFKKCVSCCKQAALTQKTATWIKQFQEEHGFGKRFNALFQLVKTRDSCQPEQAFEPSSSNSETSLDTDNFTEDSAVEQCFPKRVTGSINQLKIKWQCYIGGLETG